MKEYDIRPRKLFDAFLEVSRRDIAAFFSETDKFVNITCPACDSSCGIPSFVKHGMQYCECDRCGSLYMSPRPTRNMIDRYYRESESSKFWAERFFPETAEARREKIFRPRALTLVELLDRVTIPSPAIVADIGAGYGIFLEELAALDAFEAVVAIEPSVELARRCRDRGYRVLEKPIEDLTHEDLQASVLTSFEVIEHLFAPVDFLYAARRLLLPGGVLMFTTLTASGWDIRTLWERSKSVSPPHHINLMTTEGLFALVSRAGFDVIEITTPGQLDLDIVNNMLDEDPNMLIDRFSKYLLRQRGSETHTEFQKLLQEHQLSSHVRVLARAKS